MQNLVKIFDPSCCPLTCCHSETMQRMCRCAGHCTENVGLDDCPMSPSNFVQLGPPYSMSSALRYLEIQPVKMRGMCNDKILLLTYRSM